MAIAAWAGVKLIIDLHPRPTRVERPIVPLVPSPMRFRTRLRRSQLRDLLRGMALTLEQALQSWDRKSAAVRYAEAEQIRQEIIKLFPIEGWPTLPLERYALGQEDSS